MVSAHLDKEQIKHELAAALGTEAEVHRVIVFGSFVTDTAPHDIDVAVYQDSSESYLPLALKYRRLTRAIAARIPLDIVPLRVGTQSGFLSEIDRGEVIYER